MNKPVTILGARRLRSAAERPHLVVPGLDASLADLAAAFAVLSSNAMLIEKQPDLGLSVLPTLPEDQALVRAHVRRYLSGEALSGGIMAVFQSVATVAHAVQNTAAGLMPLARTLDTAPPAGADYAKALATFRATLDVLGKRATALDPDSRSAALPVAACAAALEAFLQGELADDAARFGEAKRQAARSGIVDKLQMQIDALQGQIDGLNRDIAEGATSQIIPALAFGFKIGKAVATETETGALLLNIGFAIKDEIDSANAFAREMQAKNDDLDDLITQYRSLVEAQIAAQQDIAVLITVAGHSAILAENVGRAARCVRLVLGQIQLLHNGIVYLASIDEPETEGYFTAQLSAGIADWKALGTSVEHLMQFSRMLGGED